MIKVISVLFILIGFSVADNFPYYGIITDSLDSPIENVRVFSLNHREKTYTNSMGAFGNLTQVLNLQSKDRNYKPQIKKNKLHFNSFKIGEEVNVEIFNLRGQKIFSFKTYSTHLGLNVIDINSINKSASSLNIIKITIGSNCYILKTFNLHKSTSYINDLDVDKTSNIRAFINDTLFISATNYKDTLIVISSNNVGKVSLSSDSSEIDTLAPMFMSMGKNPDYVFVNSVNEYNFTAKAFDFIGKDSTVSCTDNIEYVNTVNTLICGSYYIYLSVRDLSFNYAYDTINVVVFDTTDDVENDTVPPFIILEGEEVIQHLVNTPFIDPWVRAYDNVDGDITNKVRSNADQYLDTTSIGTYIIGYFVEDSAGNSAESVSRIIFIVNEI